VFPTASDNQMQMGIRVWQGELAVHVRTFPLSVDPNDVSSRIQAFEKIMRSDASNCIMLSLLDRVFDFMMFFIVL
jgi:hypothetical protein